MTEQLGDLSVGDSRHTIIVENLTRTQIVQYAGASGDYNPLHTDHEFATKVAGYPGVFAHGMLTMGLVGRMLTDWLGDGRLATFGGRFTRQVWPGDTLSATTTVERITNVDAGRIVELSFVTHNNRGQVVLSGSATAHLER